MTEPNRAPKPALELFESIMGLYDLLDDASDLLEEFAQLDDPTKPAADLPDDPAVYAIPQPVMRRANVLYHKICKALEHEPATHPAEDISDTE